jgi:hypothetical protein
VLKKKKSTRIHIPLKKKIFGNEGELKALLDEEKLKVFIANKLTVKEMLKKAEGNGTRRKLGTLGVKEQQCKC